MRHLVLLSEAQMRRIKPYFPLSRGMPRVDDQRVISGIIFVIRNGVGWRDALKEYGPHKTIYNRLIRWTRLGVFNRILAELAADGGKPDQLMVDAVPKAKFQLADKGYDATDGRLAEPEELGMIRRAGLPSPMHSACRRGGRSRRSREKEVVIFDLREEARMVFLLYFVMAGAIAFGVVAVTPQPVRVRMPAALVDAAMPLAFVFALATAFVGWLEYDERRQADVLVELCLRGGCAMTEGKAYDVEPVHQISSGGRYNPPTRGGYFKVGYELFAHSPRDNSNYSPANRLRDGDQVRVYSRDGVLVLVEVAE